MAPLRLKALKTFCLDGVLYQPGDVLRVDALAVVKDLLYRKLVVAHRPIANLGPVLDVVEWRWREPRRVPIAGAGFDGPSSANSGFLAHFAR